MAPRAGLEPATFRLTAGRSTIELPRNGVWFRFTNLLSTAGHSLRLHFLLNPFLRGDAEQLLFHRYVAWNGLVLDKRHIARRGQIEEDKALHPMQRLIPCLAFAGEAEVAAMRRIFAAVCPGDLDIKHGPPRFLLSN